MAGPAQEILVVDDTADNITVLRHLLSREGYRVRPALSGELAIKAAIAHPPDLVLLDIMMPEMDGYSVCRALKADERTRDIPVLFISALDRIDDKLRGFQVGGVDYISKPFQAEEVLARVHTHLSLRQARRQLEQQNRELHDASVLQADVERILRHDLKAPLGNIINFAELVLESQSLDADARQGVETMREAAFRMLGMVNTSFDLLKMERGTYEFHPEAVDLVAIVRRLWAEMRLAADQKHLRVELHLDGRALAVTGTDLRGHAWVQGEQLLCHSLFANLLKNAIEAAPPGSVIRWEISHLGAALRTCLRNAGEVPREIRDRFFEKYATAGKTGGTGLGTYSAALMTQTQGGQIQLDVSLAGHTSITVDLQPLEEAEEPAEVVAENPSLARAGDAKPLLLVDDDRVIHRYLKQQLPAEQWTITSAYDGPTALQLVQKRAYTVILLDSQMPGWDGLTTAVQIRDWEKQNPERCPAIIIGFSADSDTSTRLQAQAAGYQEMLSKPISAHDLRRSLDAYRLPGSRRRETAVPFAPKVVEVDADLSEILPEALEGWRRQVVELRELATSGQTRALRSLAHRMKGGLALYGLEEASAIATRIDAAALHRPNELPSRIFTDIDRLRHYLDKVSLRFRE